MDVEISGDTARWWMSAMVAGAFAAVGTTIFAHEITTAGRVLGVCLAVAALALAEFWRRCV